MKLKYVDLTKHIYSVFGVNEFLYRDIAAIAEEKYQSGGHSMRVLVDGLLLKKTRMVPMQKKYVPVYKITPLGEKLSTGVIQRVI